MDHQEKLDHVDIARKFASFAQRHRWGVDLWKFKNVILGVIFIAEADPETFDVIADELFADSDQPPKYSSVMELIREEISLGKYDWVNEFIDWDSCFIGYSDEEVSPLLCKLIEEIDEVLLGGNVDIGSIYMGLIENFGLMGGKAFGEFYTPASVVQLIFWLHSVVHPKGNKDPVVYDPACGCGNLFTAFTQMGAKCYGQDINPHTIYLAKMNLILNGCENNFLEIKRGDTLIYDKHPGLEVDIAVLNPPFNIKWDNRAVVDFKDFKEWGGYPPNKYGDLGFLQRCLAKLKEDGIGYGVFYPQVMSRDAAESTIRKHLFLNGHIRAVIDLPTGLFFSTGISTSLVVFTKQKNTHTLFINALDFGRKNLKGKDFALGEVEEIAFTYERFLKDPNSFTAKRNFAVAIEINHPSTQQKMVDTIWSLSPVDHLDLTDDEVFDYLDKKNLTRRKIKSIQKRHPDRSMYSIGEDEFID